MKSKELEMKFLILLMCLGICLADNDPTDGNDSCTTDKKFAGYNHLFFPNRDKFTNRLVCTGIPRSWPYSMLAVSQVGRFEKETLFRSWPKMPRSWPSQIWEIVTKYAI